MEPDDRSVELVAQAEVDGDVGPQLPLVVHVSEDALVTAAAVGFVERHTDTADGYQPAVDALWKIEHERRERIRVAILGCAVGRNRRRRPAEQERPARMRHLVEHEAVHADVTAHFERVIAP